MQSIRLFLVVAAAGLLGVPVAASENTDPESTGTWSSQGGPSFYGSDDAAEEESERGQSSDAGAARGRMGTSRQGSDIGSGGPASMGGEEANDLNPETAGAGTGTGSNDNMGRTTRMPDNEGFTGGNTGGGQAAEQGTSTFSGTGRVP